jgi:hypothetical protein
MVEVPRLTCLTAKAGSMLEYASRLSLVWVRLVLTSVSRYSVVEVLDLPEL